MLRTEYPPKTSATGVASWYGPDFHGKRTANGEIYNMQRLTGAHTTLPLPSYVEVTNLANGRTIVVRINDRGPYKRGRIIDLSKQSASALGFKQQGTATVRVQYIGPAPLNDDGSNLMAMNEELERGTPLRQMIAAAGDDTSTKVTMGVRGSSLRRCRWRPCWLVGARVLSAVSCLTSFSTRQDQLPHDRCRPTNWRDRGHPTFMKPSDGDPDKHMFDPDRLS
ncbi:MAG: septal ring lytic transglycosylase RlpA family protein [Aquincola sp.]|nr:septal ring lytic transglycosylase RlpA family protein [Aquincola sp.]